MGPNCVRCQGLVVWEWDEALQQPNMKCINCAARPLDPPVHPPTPHPKARLKVGNLTTCRCGREKVEWRAYCRMCSLRKLNAEQRRKRAVKQGVRQGRITNGREV